MGREKKALRGNTGKGCESDCWSELSDFGLSGSVCSSMDCTGLIPAMPSSEEELEAYEEMYRFCGGAPERKTDAEV